MFLFCIKNKTFWNFCIFAVYSIEVGYTAIEGNNGMYGLWKITNINLQIYKYK